MSFAIKRILTSIDNLIIDVVIAHVMGLILTINAKKELKCRLKTLCTQGAVSFINNKISMFIKLSLFVQIRTRLANYSVTQKERSKNEKLK